MQRQLLIFVFILIWLSSCVIHLKPGISWCTSKTCIYDAYGLYAVKDFSRRTKHKIVAMERRSKQHSHHHSGESSGIAAKKSRINSNSKANQLAVYKDTLIPPIENELAVVDTPKVLENLRINFAFDKDTISAQDKINISQYMMKVPVEATAYILIKGFTDNSGSQGYNKHLSIKRAKRVSDYLISLGIPRSKLSFKGFDFKDPVADNKTEEGRSLNRRVEIEIVFKRNL